MAVGDPIVKAGHQFLLPDDREQSGVLNLSREILVQFAVVERVGACEGDHLGEAGALPLHDRGCALLSGSARITQQPQGMFVHDVSFEPFFFRGVVDEDKNISLSQERRSPTVLFSRSTDARCLEQNWQAHDSAQTEGAGPDEMFRFARQT